MITTITSDKSTVVKLQLSWGFLTVKGKVKGVLNFEGGSSNGDD